MNAHASMSAPAPAYEFKWTFYNGNTSCSLIVIADTLKDARMAAIVRFELLQKLYVTGFKKTNFHKQMDTPLNPNLSSPYFEKMFVGFQEIFSIALGISDAKEHHMLGTTKYNIRPLMAQLLAKQPTKTAFNPADIESFVQSVEIYDKEPLKTLVPVKVLCAPAAEGNKIVFHCF